MARKIILHVGFPKCGSSALQAFLCQHSDFRNNEIKYHVVKNGSLISGKQLKNQTSLRPWGHLATSSGLKAAIDLVCEKYSSGVHVMSHENWAYSASELDFQDKRDDLEIEILAYVRPQVSWLQSAWWQWFAWSGKNQTPMDLWPGIVPRIKWAETLDQFEDMPLVNKVTVRLHDAELDIAEDFMQVVGATMPDRTRRRNHNAAMTSTHIGLYNSFPWLRDAHGNRVDALLKIVLRKGNPAPWVIPERLTELVISEMKADNLKLLKKLDPASQRRMELDPRWWEPGAFAGKTNVEN